MINGDLNEFVNLLYYGQEIVFIYQNKKYFIQVYSTEHNPNATMELVEVNDQPFKGYLWECQADTMRECAEAFLAATIWDGKDFMQIQEEVIWSDW